MEHPHTHPTRPDLGRVETDPDVLEVALQLRNMLSNEEVWYVLQMWKDKVRADAKKETYEKDDPLDYNESSLQPWDNIGGQAFSEREAAEFPNCGKDCI
jgi:hypothetical protein